MAITDLIPLINVENTARSIDFYAGALGFEVAQDFQDGDTTIWALLKCGAIALMVNQSDRSDSAGRRARPSYGDTVFYVFVESARETHADLKARGFPVGDVTAEAYGMEEFVLRDPDGYEIAIGSRLMQIA